MWWLIFVASVIAFLVFAALYLELRSVRRNKFDRTVDPSVNHTNLQAQSNSMRNQSSGL